MKISNTTLATYLEENILSKSSVAQTRCLWFPGEEILLGEELYKRRISFVCISHKYNDERKINSR